MTLHILEHGNFVEAWLQVPDEIHDLVTSTLSVHSSKLIFVKYDTATSTKEDPMYAFCYGLGIDLGPFLSSLIGASVSPPSKKYGM
jgi:hypothetical protein